MNPFRLLLVSVLSGVAPAAIAATPRSIQLGTSSNSLLQTFTTLIQALVNFVGGPLAVAITASAILAGAAAWYLAPKDSIVGTILKVIGGGLILLNLAAIIDVLIV
jgi:hypothetical protein